MRFYRVLSLAVVVVLLAFTGFAVVDVDAQRGAALGGVVSSREEGKMEGVLVTARRERRAGSASPARTWPPARMASRSGPSATTWQTLDR